MKTTNAGYVESIEKQSSTSCQDVKNLQDQNMSSATTIHSKFLAVKWAMEMGIMPEGTKWYAEKWENEKVLENGEKRLY